MFITLCNLNHPRNAKMSVKNQPSGNLLAWGSLRLLQRKTSRPHRTQLLLSSLRPLRSHRPHPHPQWSRSRKTPSDLNSDSSSIALAENSAPWAGGCSPAGGSSEKGSEQERAELYSAGTPRRIEASTLARIWMEGRQCKSRIGRFRALIWIVKGRHWSQ